MKTYIVKVPVTTLHLYKIEAEDERHAKELVLEGEGDFIQRDDIAEREDLDSNNWQVQTKEQFHKEWDEQEDLIDEEIDNGN